MTKKKDKKWARPARPVILDIHETDAFYNTRELYNRQYFIGKKAVGIRNAHPALHKDGYYNANIFVSGRWVSFYAVKLSYIPEKFLK